MAWRVRIRAGPIAADYAALSRQIADPDTSLYDRVAVESLAEQAERIMTRHGSRFHR